MNAAITFHSLNQRFLLLSLLFSVAIVLGYWVLRPTDWMVNEERIDANYRWLVNESYPHRGYMLRVYEAQMILESPGLPAGLIDFLSRCEKDATQWVPHNARSLRYVHHLIPFDTPHGLLHVSTSRDIRLLNFVGMFWHVESPDGHQFVIQRMDAIGLKPIWVMNVHGEIVYNAETTDSLRQFIMGEHRPPPQRLDHNLYSLPQICNPND